MKNRGVIVLVFVVGSLLLLGVLAILLSTFSNTEKSEIPMALIIVIALTTLMILLFIVSAGFNFLGLSDSKQALGLPEGSIRAVIALVLVLIFVMFGLYLFRMVGIGYYSYPLTNQTPSDLAKLKGRMLFVSPNSSNPTNFDVLVQSDLSEDGVRLAQQLTTTVGTLVVAVAGFYFGSTAVSGAVAAERTGTAPTPVIRGILPTEASKNSQLELKVLGTNLNKTRAVRFIRGSEQMPCTDVLSNSEQIRCTVKIDKEPGAKWDLVVTNDDGVEARLPEAFNIV